MHAKCSIRLLAATACLLGCGALASRADTHYVSAAGDNVAPYTNGWANAAWQIQAAVNEAVANDVVLVTNGTYNTGGLTNYPAGTVLTNRVAIDKAITVRSANNDPANTIIKGAWDPATNGPAAVRCVYLTNGSALIGFTLTNGATLTIADPDDATGKGNGGGVYSQSTSTTISNCVIAGNSAGSAGGAWGGTLYNCAFVGNSAPTRGGGARSATLFNCTITSNSVSDFGGGAHSCTLSNCTIIGNSAKVNNGGGANGCTIYNCTIASNSAGPGYGGGAMSGTLSNCLIVGNSAGGGGGVAYATAVYNCLIIGNSASGAGGGTLDGLIYNCTIAGNYEPSRGGGSVDSKLYNCIVYFNTPLNYETTTCVFTNCCTTPSPSQGSGNITSDPQFVNTNAGNYRLSANSPSINAGINQSWMTNAVDFDGKIRVRYRTVDMGAFETIYKGTVFTSF